LALMERFGGLRVAPGIDYGQERAPLLEGNAGIEHNVSNK